jgi:uncharacterized protein YbgA (DUF1722 family)/uncharacterized protein YbbK (DUF523 family)
MYNYCIIFINTYSANEIAMTEQTYRPQIGVSACLLGKNVRHDGSHRKNRYVTDVLTKHISMVPICPEMEIGLGTPRDAIQLRKPVNRDEIRLVFNKQPDRDLTETMEQYASERLSSLPVLDGYIVKKDSPSCGLTRVAVFHEKTGQRQKNGIGIFTRMLMQAFPQLPVEDEGRLCDHDIRENFLERVYAHQRWRQLNAAANSLQAFRDFHQRYKLMLMAKNERDYRKLGRMVATVNQANLDETKATYFELFMNVMASIPKAGHHVNVLQHVMGYLKHDIDSRDKAEILHWLDTYRHQRVNRITPVALIRHHLRRYPNDYIASQYYFTPYPKQLMLHDQV